MKLKRLQVNAAGGIHPSAPVIVDFSKSNFVVAEGDNGLNKTSLLTALLVACGYKSKDDKDFVNLESGKLDIEFEFVGNDRRTYIVKVTKSRFNLTYEGEALPEPITKMKELLGIPGVSPMEIKNKPLKDIVKWLASYTNKGAEEFEARMAKIKDGIKTAVRSRADANRSAKGLKEYLGSETMYTDWEGSEKKYAKKVDIKTLSAQLDDAGKKSDKLIQAEAKMKQLKERHESIAAQIESLKVEEAEITKSMKTGEKFVEDNKGAKKEYDEIKAQYDTAAQKGMDFEKWQDIKRKKIELDEFETLSQKADAKEKELLEEAKELQAEIIPDVKGVELVLEDVLEDGKVVKKEGLYRNGVNVAQMSESEFWSTCLEIWKKNKTKILVIDNFQSLGSMAVDNINKLIKDGAYVFAAEMDRSKKELEIDYR